MEQNKSNNVIAITSLSIVTEAIITYYTDISSGHCHWKLLFSALIGIFLSICYNLDLLATIGIQSKIKYVGDIVTGIIIARGSNYVWEIIQKITQRV